MISFTPTASGTTLCPPLSQTCASNTGFFPELQSCTSNPACQGRRPGTQLIPNGTHHFPASHPANPLLISILVNSTPETLLLKQEIWKFSLISLSPHISRQSPCFIVFNHLIISLPYCHCYCLNLGLLFCKDSFSSPASMFTLLTSPSTV